MTEKVDVIELRKFHDGTYSVMVRVWTPQKHFYEHPTFINLTEEAAKQQCMELQKNPPTVDEVVARWELIGN